MILTCPACGTQYVVKDGAIPPGGRQVRCAACRHSWHQDPEEAVEGAPVAETALEAELAPEQTAEGEPSADEYSPPPPVEGLVEPPMAAPVPPPEEEVEPETAAPAEAESGQPAAEPVEPADDDFSPFARRDALGTERRRSPVLVLLLVVLLLGAIAAAFWFLAPPEWRERIGLSTAGETPLQLMMTHSDRQKLASGNELLAVSGRVINPTDQSQNVPPIHAELRSSTGELVYSWTIAPPARTLPPRASATFNSAEVNVPAGGDELTVTLGSPKA